MTIDETIKDLEYGTEQLEMEIKSGLWIKGSEPELSCKEGIALNKQYIEWLTELKEAKRLLKAAMEDMKMLYEASKDEGCVGIEFKWRYADEALKLIGDEPNGI